MKILIADDEPKIRKGLASHLQRSELAFEQIELAEDGRDALEKARAIRPDIILADICMPKLGGLEFIEEITCELEDVKIIIISGYDEFSYAQRAIRFGVCEYLLKPIDLVEFEGLLKRLCAEIEQQREKKKKAVLAIDMVNQNKENMVNHFFRELIRGNVKQEDVENRAKLLSIPLPDPAAMIVVKEIERLVANEVKWDRDLLSYAMGNISMELCGELKQKTVFVDAQQNLVLLCQYTDQVDYVQIQTQIAQAVENYLGYVVRTAMTSFTKPARNLLSAYKGLIHELSTIKEYSQVVIEAKQYIEQHYYQEDLTLQSMADAIQVNASYLSRLMHKQLGMSFVDYLTDVRMKKAVLLLSSYEKDMKLYEIAERLGFNSQHYFCRVFKKYYGVSPIQYRLGRCEG